MGLCAVTSVVNDIDTCKKIITKEKIEWGTLLCVGFEQYLAKG